MQESHSAMVVTHCLNVTLPLTINETLKWLSSLYTHLNAGVTFTYCGHCLNATLSLTINPFTAMLAAPVLGSEQ